MFVGTLWMKTRIFKTHSNRIPMFWWKEAVCDAPYSSPLWVSWARGGTSEHVSYCALRTYVGPRVRGRWRTYGVLCVTVAANKLGFGLNVFETNSSFTPSNCLHWSDSWKKTGLLTEWPKCRWDRQKQSFSVFYRHTDCKLKKGLFGKDSPLRDHLMFNYMQLETLQSSSVAKQGIKTSDRHSGWCRVSFWAPGTKIQARSGVFSHSEATIILNYSCPRGVIWSQKMSHKNSSKLFVSLLFLLLPSFYFLALFFSAVAFLSLFPPSKWHCDVEFTRCANFLPHLTLLWQKAQVAQQVLSGSS